MNSNVSYQLISYTVSNYFKNRTIPIYSGNFSREYYHICVGLNTSLLLDPLSSRNRYNNNSQWMKPNVNDWFAMVMGRDNVYNVGFLVGNISQFDIVTNNVKQVNSITNITNTTSQ